MKTASYLAVICLLLFLIAGCAGRKTEPSSAIRNKPQTNVQKTRASTPLPEPFSLGDTKLLGIRLGMTQKELESILGKPESSESDWSEIGENLYHLKYDFGTVELVAEETSPDLYISAIGIYSPGFNGPRGIQVGDSVESVLSIFPNAGFKAEGGSRWLYGKGQSSHGYLCFGSDKMIDTIYYEFLDHGGATFLSIAAENNIVKSICVSYQLN